jgi:type I restriction enzyme, R subunit
MVDALVAHAAMSKEALDSSEVCEGFIDALLGPGQLYDALRQKDGFESRVGR